MLKMHQLLDEARQLTGFDDFGEPTFYEGLERLLFAVEHEAKLSINGQDLANQQLITLLLCRLEIEHWYGEHPEIDDEEISRPLIGLGLPRTGSTALACLLAEDPSARSIRTWEASRPCPPPEAATQHSDPRVEAQRLQLEETDKLTPRLKMMVPRSPTSPSECQEFMAYEFKSQLFPGFMRVPSYTKWLMYDADMIPCYRYVKKTLKLLQWRCPPYRWRLKNPSHIIFIEALDHVFPDARYWMTHRSIERVIPSVIDLHFELAGAFTDHIDLEWLRQMDMEWTELGLRRVAEFRESGNDRRFFDIEFAELQSDPLAVIGELYRFLGEELTPEAYSRMTSWWKETPANLYGKHEIDLDRLGIHISDIKRQFSFYRGNSIGSPSG